MDKRILIIGSLNMDIVIEMKRMPLIGETVLGENLTYVPGGKGANQAYAAGKLGGKVTMLGCVGDDSLGQKLKDNLAKSGTDASYIRNIEGKPTGTAIIYVNDDGDNSIVVISGANEACDVEYLKQNEALFETELLKLTGQQEMTMDNIRNGAHALLEKGVKNILVTLGDKGVLFVNDRKEKLFPARKVTAVDTTAAGDCFNGAFVTGLAEEMSFDEAIVFANMASSLAVTRKGAQSSIPGREELEELSKRKSNAGL